MGEHWNVSDMEFELGTEFSDSVYVPEHCNIYDADHRGRCYGCRNVFGQMFTVHELLDAVA